MVKLYLDTCVWCRPFDKPEKRILKESEALMEILKMADRKQIEITGSGILMAEVPLYRQQRKERLWNL